MLRSAGGLRDAFVDVHGEAPDVGLSCDCPSNTWTKGKPLDDQAVKHGGKRLDYVLYRAADAQPLRWQCTQHELAFTERIEGMDVSYSDHYGVLATLTLGTAGAQPGAPPPSAEVATLAVSVLKEAFRQACAAQRTQLGFFVVMLAVATVLVVGNACASAWLHGGDSVAPSIISSIMLLVVTWAGTTALYSGVVWGEWNKRTWMTLTAGALRTALAEMELWDLSSRQLAQSKV